MTFDQLMLIAPIVLTLLTLLGSAYAWLSRRGKRLGEEQRGRADTIKAQAEAAASLSKTAAELVQLRDQLDEPLNDALTAAFSQIAILEAQVAELLPLKEEVQRYAVELEELRPYKARVVELERELEETREELNRAKDRERQLLARIAKLEKGDTGPLRSK